ncbi:MAG: hypothetical protein WBM13_11325 [Bacteroidia bacterium]
MEFYYDNGNIRSVLTIAKPTEFVRFTYFLGMDDFTKRPKTIYNNKVSSELRLMADWLPADMMWRRLLDNHLFVQEFTLEFDSGMIADFRTPQDLIITFKDKDKVRVILDAFSVHYRARAPLLAKPGSLYSVNQRTGSYSFVGYFKTIRIWLKQHVFERKLGKSFQEINLN